MQAVPDVHSSHAEEDDDAEQEERDAEAEEQLLEGVSGDPLAAYDVDVREEGHAIQEYLDRLASMQGIHNR